MIRGEGKNNAGVKKVNFWLHYRRTVKENTVARKTYDKVVKELFEEFSEIILDAGAIKLVGLGDFSIKGYKPKRLDKNGNIKKKTLRIDWDRTWKLWNDKYPGKTIEEIKKIKDKPLLHHLNMHSDGYVYEVLWEKITSNVKGKSYYKFIPTRKNKRKLAKRILENKQKYYE